MDTPAGQKCPKCPNGWFSEQPMYQPPGAEHGAECLVWVCDPCGFSLRAPCEDAAEADG